MTSREASSALFNALFDLVEQCRGTCAAVIDEGNGLWCVTHAGFDAAADRFYREEIAGRPDVQLTKGQHLHVVRQAPPAHAYVAESFASIYVVILWFAGDFDPFTTRARVREALPRIEALTLAIPPPFGPDAGSAAGESRA